MSARKHKRTTNGAILSSVAESIGTALGTIAAKADAAQKAMSRSSAVQIVEREAKKLARSGKRAARKTSAAARKTAGAATRKVKKSKVAKATRRRATVKRAARRG